MAVSDKLGKKQVRDLVSVSQQLYKSNILASSNNPIITKLYALQLMNGPVLVVARAGERGVRTQ